jgi:high-affinity iron transporter
VRRAARSGGRGAKAVLVVRIALAVLVLTVGGLLAGTTANAQETAPAQTVWRLLDYMAVDYGGAVTDGRVRNAAEYAEMLEFAGQVRQRLGDLPANPVRLGLEAQARTLEAAVRDKADPAVVARVARRLGSDLLAAYPVPLAPQSLPDLARGASLYAENCSSCHGASGNGKGPMAAQLDPLPIDFTDRARARERSAFALYQVIEQGLDGTAMPSFAHLPPQDRWALAFYIGRFAYPDATQGERLWNADPQLRSHVPDMTALSAMTPALLETSIGEENGAAVIAYLRAYPEAIAAVSSSTNSLAVARQKLAASLKAYTAGDRRAATDLALAAYLDGFEPVEPVLAARNARLMGRIETAMGGFRAAIGRGAPTGEVEAQVEAIEELIVEAEVALSPERASDISSFLGAFTILLREGLEALLVVVAMIAFLRKADRQDMLCYVHGGWTTALVAGGLLWMAASHLIEVSGASRELTEGFGSLLAAFVLLSVSIWMHGKAQADVWQRYIREKITAALSKRSAWFLFGLTSRAPGPVSARWRQLLGRCSAIAASSRSPSFSLIAQR